MLFKAVAGPGPKLVNVLGGPRYTDHRHVEVAPFDHGLKGGKDLLVSQVPGRSKEDKSIRVWKIHCFLLILKVFRGGPRNRSAWPRAPSAQSRPRPWS